MLNFSLRLFGHEIVLYVGREDVGSDDGEEPGWMTDDPELLFSGSDPEDFEVGP